MTFFQSVAVLLPLAASAFLLRSNLGLSAEAIAEIASTHWDGNLRAGESLARQQADSRVGLGLLCLGVAAQLRAVLHDPAWQDFGPSWPAFGAGLAVVAVLAAVGQAASGRLSARTERKVRQTLKPGGEGEE